jgi:ribosomal protein L37AE/L43A
MYHCVKCGEGVNPQRYKLGFFLCLGCGEIAAKKKVHTIVPLAKSNYQPVTDLSILKMLNKYAHEK